MHIEEINTKDIGSRQPAVVMGLGTIGLAIARSLGQMGVAVTGVDKSRLSVGQYSRYCKGIVCPDMNLDEAGYIKLLMDLAAGAPEKPVLIPSRDQEVALAARYMDKLSRSFRIPWANNKVISQLVDKRRFYELIRDMDIDYPATYVPENARHAAEISREIPYPCIVKPIDTVPFSSQFSVKCFFATNAEELLRGYERAVNAGHEVIFQEVIPGDDRCLFMPGGYFDRDSEPLGLFMQRKIRSAPAQFGIGSLIESWRDPEVLRMGTEFLKEIRFHGIGIMEFKRDPRNGRYKVIEVNARPWTQLYLATLSGVNLPYIAYRDALGEPVEKMLDYEAGIKWLCMSEDFRACAGRFAAGTLGIGEYLGSLRGKTVYSSLDFTDPVPFLSSPLQLGNMSINYLRKRFRLATSQWNPTAPA